jgi:predicted permease
MATISGVRRTIVGVMPDSFEFPSSGEVWLPLTFEASTRAGRATTFGVLREGRNPTDANAELVALSRQYESATPGAVRLRVGVLSFTKALSRGVEVLSGLLVGALVLVLLVIAANIANLVLARAVSRSRELAVSAALGATRGRLVAQIFVEVLLLAGIAAVIGLSASQAALTWVRAAMTDMPFWVRFDASPRTIVFVVAATVLASAIGGVAPALRATRRDLAAALASSSRGSSAAFGWSSAVMVAAQVALSVALLNGALLMARGVAGYMSPALPIQASEVLTARVWMDTAAPDAVLDAVAAMPGVSAAGASSSLPGLSPPAVMTEVDRAANETAVPARPAPVVAVRGHFFESLGARETAGRLFTASDFGDQAAPVAIVNQSFVRKFLDGRNPLGRRVRALSSPGDSTPGPWREVVGVVPDLGLSAGDESMSAGYYVPMTAGPLFHISLRASGDVRRLTSPLRDALSVVDPALQIRELVPLNEVGKEDRVVFAGIGAALGALGGMALLLSVIGTYAILSLAVTRRTREIGIRSALGATRASILRTLMGRTALPPAIGAAAGMALAQLLASARGIFAFRLPESSGPWGLPLIAAVMIAAGVLSAWLPARRALAIEAADALRAE